MRGQTKTETVSGHHYAKSKVRESPWQNSERIWRTTRSHDGIGDSKGIWRFPKQVVRLVQEISIIDGISKISVREDGIDVFFVKKIQQKTLCPKQHESTERLDLMQRAFENEGLESMVLKTWTPPKQSAPKRKWKRFHRRLCDGMERELENRQKISSAEEAVETSGEEETVEPSGEGDERLCDDVESLKSCLVKANLSAELKSLSVETPSLNCVEKTETEKLSEEGHEDPCDDGSGYNDESLETESELWRGSEEQPVRQEDFVQQLAKQEAAPEASEQNVAEEDDEQGNNVIKGDTGHVNAVSDDTQNICEAPEAEMTTQSEKEGKIVIAVEEKTLQGSVQGGSAIAAEEIFEAKKVEMSTTQSEKECRIATAVEGKALQENMQGDTAIVAEKTKSRQKITKKKAKKDHKVQHAYPWKPGYQPRKHSPEEMEIMLNFCMGKVTLGDTKAKMLRTTEAVA